MKLGSTETTFCPPLGDGCFDSGGKFKVVTSLHLAGDGVDPDLAVVLTSAGASALTV
jgi:hypothetical protein